MVSNRQMAPLPGSQGIILINLVNLDFINSNFSFNFLKVTHIDHTPSDAKQKFIFKINSIRISDFAPFLRITGDHSFKFALRRPHSQGYQHLGTIDINF